MTTHEANGGGWPVNDIGGLAREVPEVDTRRYFDEQARLSDEEALVKWPVLARRVGLVRRAPPVKRVLLAMPVPIRMAATAVRLRTTDELIQRLRSGSV